MAEPTPDNKFWTKFFRIGLAVYLVISVILILGLIALVFFGYKHFRAQWSARTPTDTTIASDQYPYVNLALPADAPSLGDPNAPVTMVEFADFQCPFCKEFHDTVWPGLKSKYVDTGKVRFVFQDFAFLGDESVQAASAAKCAAEQNQFWPFHDLLYAQQGQENSGTFNLAKLQIFAQQLNLKEADFRQCLTSRKYDQTVIQETIAGQGFTVDATPTIFINGKKYQGVGSIAEYSQAIEAALTE